MPLAGAREIRMVMGLEVVVVVPVQAGEEAAPCGRRSLAEVLAADERHWRGGMRVRSMWCAACGAVGWRGGSDVVGCAGEPGRWSRASRQVCRLSSAAQQS